MFLPSTLSAEISTTGLQHGNECDVELRESCRTFVLRGLQLILENSGRLQKVYKAKKTELCLASDQRSKSDAVFGGAGWFADILAQLEQHTAIHTTCVLD